MQQVLDHLLIAWLPFWAALFTLVGNLAWPAAAFGAVFLFKSELRALIPKIDSLSAVGVSIGVKGGQTKIPLDEPPIKASLESLSANVLRSQPVAEIQKSLKTGLVSIPEAQQKDQLLTALAQTRLESTFNLAYANIFGSQIRAMRMINERGGSVKREVAEAEFEKLKSGEPSLADWSLDQYLNFLRHFLFISEDQGQIKLSDYGREFLAYLSRRGLSEDRAH